MTDFDRLIAEVANATVIKEECVENAYKKTLHDYECVDNIEQGGPRLNMIAWGRK